jgi:hypothetical protein
MLLEPNAVSGMLRCVETKASYEYFRLSSVYACSSQQLESVGPLIVVKTRNAPQPAERLNRPRCLHTAHVSSASSEVNQ